jgi:biotin transport system substrate-specific component
VQTTIPSRVIAGAVLPRHWIVTAGLVAGFASLTAAAAQIRIPLPFTPVPITGSTFAVLLSGAALGSTAGAASQGLYLLAGLWLPVFTGGNSGWQYFSGATGGFLIGFVAAAWLTGYLAERHQDRAVASAIPAFLAGSLVIYLCGVPWLAHVLDSSWTVAVEKGVAPFVAGDLLKAAAAGLLLPTAWRVTGTLRTRR